jgi:acetylornithine deacetylase/succinyl-diaminopimelate desuccinylase-like protein
MHLFGEVLGIPFAFGGLGHGGRSHAPNEFISAEGVRDFFRSMASFLFAFAGSADPC